MKRAQVTSSKFIQLAEQMSSHIIKSRSENTNKKYFAAFNRWDLFISAEGGNSLPAESIHVALYVTHLIDKGHSSSVIEGAVYAIKWAHSLRGFRDPKDNCFVKNLLESAKRQCKKKVNKKDPVTSDQVKELCKKHVHTEDAILLRDLTLLILCFTGFLRYDEARSLKCNDVSIYDDYISLNIAKSKTDQYRQGNSVVISAGVTEACPVKMVKKYINVARISNLDSNHFFFKPAYRSKGVSALIRKDKPLSYTTARERVISLLKEVCGDANLGLHSLRAGGATMVANTSTKDRLWKIHGRWKTDKAKDGYVVDTLDNKLEVTKSLML
ncbi:uncharacterized protein LOC115926073 [Strongylocentrotus purpuratus]|uniref:Tyr recombinase domain-containing protein n=1 Tax=Strongylocentrotus purpuratus TaxID=7668 RepID=A0A7M7P4P6_STRPU|nr:uncharacterized protein LOC115926073 [Strongylocentrotus purpuratus]